MLYVTTRAAADAFTAFRALTENRGPEGGFFVPMRLPVFDEDQIAQLAEKTFSQNVAEVLNLFFGTKLDGWSVELVIGRYPVRLTALKGRVVAAEAWQNPVYRFDRLVMGVEKLIRQADQINRKPSDWLVIAARIAVLFGIYGQLMESGALSKNQKIDLSVPSKDLSPLIAAVYAKTMGLPIRTIICSCSENHAIWNLFHKGELRTDVIAMRTHTPECDYTVPADLERLIFAVSGHNEVKRFCEACRTGGTYYAPPELTEKLREGIYISVVSSKRMASTIPNLYKTTGFLADPYTALSFCGLTDYRAATGDSKTALIISEESPLFSLEFVAQCMNMMPDELKERLN